MATRQVYVHMAYVAVVMDDRHPLVTPALQRRLRLAEAANEDLRARLAAAGTSGPSGSVATGSSAAAAELAAATEARRRLEAEVMTLLVLLCRWLHVVFVLRRCGPNGG